MSKGFNLETFRFIGDSGIDKAQFIENEAVKGVYTQTEVIEALGQNKKHINGGLKLKTEETSPRQAYLIYFGGTKDEPKQIVKIIFDKKNLEIGDRNALAIENICQYAVKVKNNKIRDFVLSGIATFAIVGSLVGGIIMADKKESDIDRKKAVENQNNLQQHQMENGTYKAFLEDNGLILDEVLEENKGRSF